MKDVDKIVRDLRRQGYDVKKGRRLSHYQVREGRRLVAVFGSTPSDVKSLRNLRGQLRRAESGRGAA